MVKRVAPDPAETAEKMKALDERQRHLDTIRSLFDEAFASKCPLLHFGLYCYDENKFHAFIKLRDSSDVSLAQESGLSDAMRDFIFQQLQAHGRGSSEMIILDVEFDYQNMPPNPVPFDHKKRWEKAKLADEEAHRHLDDVVDLFKERFGDCSALVS